MNQPDAAPRVVPQLNLPGWGPRADRFVFCPRAGLIQFEKETDDEGDEAQREPWANLSYVPLYDVREIEEKIDREARRLFACSSP